MAAPTPEEQRQRLEARDGEKLDQSRLDPEANRMFEEIAHAAAREVDLHIIGQSSPETMFEEIRKQIDVTHVPS